MDESGSEKHDLLTLFMKHGGVQKKQLKQNEIRDITMNFVIAARGKKISLSTLLSMNYQFNFEMCPFYV